MAGIKVIDSEIDGDAVKQRTHELRAADRIASCCCEEDRLRQFQGKPVHQLRHHIFVVFVGKASCADFVPVEWAGKTTSWTNQVVARRGEVLVINERDALAALVTFDPLGGLTGRQDASPDSERILGI